MDGMHGVQAQGVDVTLPLPVEGVFDEVTAHVVAVGAVEVERLAPWRAVPVGEIGREVGEGIAFGADVVVDDVEHHGQTMPVSRIHQPFQSDRAAVGVLRRERIDAVVAPVARAGKLGDRHQLDGRDAEIAERGQVGYDR